LLKEAASDSRLQMVIAELVLFAADKQCVTLASIMQLSVGFGSSTATVDALVHSVWKHRRHCCSEPVLPACSCFFAVVRCRQVVSAPQDVCRMVSTLAGKQRLAIASWLGSWHWQCNTAHCSL
jgi:hypothetical protein